LRILTDLQKKVLLQFSGLPDKEAFYLTGGTALSAIFLKHRRSNDLDFFTHNLPEKDVAHLGHTSTLPVSLCPQFYLWTSILPIQKIAIKLKFWYK
jgi:hypothetical protein